MVSPRVGAATDWEGFWAVVKRDELQQILDHRFMSNTSRNVCRAGVIMQEMSQTPRSDFNS